MLIVAGTFTVILQSQWNLIRRGQFSRRGYPLPPPLPCLLKTGRSQEGAEHGGHHRFGFSNTLGRPGGFGPRRILQLRTRAVPRVDLPPGRAQDMLTYFCLGEGEVDAR